MLLSPLIKERNLNSSVARSKRAESVTPHMLLNGNWYGAIDSNGIAWCAPL